MPANPRTGRDLVHPGHGARVPSRLVNTPQLVITAILVAAASTSITLAAPPPAGWYPAAGPIWFLLTDSAVRSTYAGGPGVSGGIGYAVNDRFGAEVRMGWFRRTGTPEARLAESAKSRLSVTPFTAEFIFRTPVALATGGTGRARAFVAAGPALVFSRERFDYRYAGDEPVTSIEGRRSDPGGTASLGLEGSAGNSRLGWRLVFRAVLTGGHREVLRPGGRSDERGSNATPSHASFGFELTWR
jgi:hypothetical protein